MLEREFAFQTRAHPNPYRMLKLSDSLSPNLVHMPFWCPYLLSLRVQIPVRARIYRLCLLEVVCFVSAHGIVI